MPSHIHAPTTHLHPLQVSPRTSIQQAKPEYDTFQGPHFGKSSPEIGLPIETIKGTSPGFERKIRRYLEQYPAHLRHAVQQGGFKMVLAKTFLDGEKHVWPNVNRTADETREAKNTAGAMVKEEFGNGRYIIIGEKQKIAPDMKGLLFHEMSHAVDEMYGLRFDRDIRRAYFKDLDRIASQEFQDSISPYKRLAVINFFRGDVRLKKEDPNPGLGTKIKKCWRACLRWIKRQLFVPEGMTEAIAEIMAWNCGQGSFGSGEKVGSLPLYEEDGKTIKTIYVPEKGKERLYDDKLALECFPNLSQCLQEKIINNPERPIGKPFSLSRIGTQLALAWRVCKGIFTGIKNDMSSEKEPTPKQQPEKDKKA